MKNSLSILMVLVVLLLTTPLHAAGPGERKEQPKDFITRIQTHRPAERIEAIKAKLEAAKDEKEIEYLKEQRDKAQKEINFYAMLNTEMSNVRSAEPTNNSARSSETRTGDVPESKNPSHEDVEIKALERAARKRTGPQRTMVESRTTEQLVKDLSDLYEIQKDANSKALLARTAEEIKKSGSQEAKEGLNKLLTEILKANGDPEALIKGINELTKKAGLNAEETLEIMRATCPDRCVANKGACRIASQLMKQLATVATGVALTAFTVSNIEFGEKPDSNEEKQTVTVTLKSIKDPTGPTKELKFKLEDKEQPEEKFPSAPQGTNG